MRDFAAGEHLVSLGGAVWQMLEVNIPTISDGTQGVNRLWVLEGSEYLLDLSILGKC